MSNLTYFLIVYLSAFSFNSATKPNDKKIEIIKRNRDADYVYYNHRCPNYLIINESIINKLESITLIKGVSKINAHKIRSLLKRKKYIYKSDLMHIKGIGKKRAESIITFLKKIQ